MELKQNKDIIYQIIALSVIIVLSIIWIHNIKSNIEYADFVCPICDSDEVLKLSANETEEKYECADCHALLILYNDSL